MAADLSIAEQQKAHIIRVWSVLRVVPSPKPPPRKKGERRQKRAAPATQVVSYHLTRASAAEDADRRGGPAGDETEGFEVQASNLLEAWKFGTFSVEEVRREIERETGPLLPEERALMARVPLWTVWYEDNFGYGEDRDPAVPVAHFFTEAEAEKYVKDRGGEPTPEQFVGHSWTRGTLLEAVRMLEVNSKARELLATWPPEIEQRMFERVCAFLVKEAGAKRGDLSPDTSIVDDLGVTGRDGARLMAAFFDAFGVRPDGFEVTRYFVPERIGLLGSIGALMSDAPPRRALIVDDLVGAALVLRWLS